MVNGSELRELLKGRKLTVLSGGFPCQPVSLAGNKLGKDDPRWLWDEYFRLIRELKPSWVVAENVSNLVNIPEYDNILQDLEEEGFNARAYVLSAISFGAPHIRKRCFVVAHADSQSDMETDSKTLAERINQKSVRARITERAWTFAPRAYWTENRPEICRMDDGVPRALDKFRLQALGNAVVPAQIRPFFEAIREIELLKSDSD